MKINNVHYRTLWLNNDGWSVNTFDQTLLPHDIRIIQLRTLAEAATAITTMQVRGAPLIGATAAYGMALALRQDASDAALQQAYELLYATRPTAVNLRWALDDMHARLTPLAPAERAAAAYYRAGDICEQDIAICAAIGRHGLQLIQAIAARKPAGEPVNILTHCNAGWLATLDWGTATAPIYQAHDAGIAVHVWVDETRPLLQGARLNMWELAQENIDATLICDNMAAMVMRKHKIDLCIVGADRIARNGDTANKIGTYGLAVAARHHGVPFYVAAPISTIDFAIASGVEIPIEERAASEITHGFGRQTAPEGAKVYAPAFDVTPVELISGIITESGIISSPYELQLPKSLKNT